MKKDRNRLIIISLLLMITFVISGKNSFAAQQTKDISTSITVETSFSSKSYDKKAKKAYVKFLKKNVKKYDAFSIQKVGENGEPILICWLRNSNVGGHIYYYKNGKVKYAKGAFDTTFGKKGTIPAHRGLYIYKGQLIMNTHGIDYCVKVNMDGTISGTKYISVRKDYDFRCYKVKITHSKEGKKSKPQEGLPDNAYDKEIKPKKNNAKNRKKYS